MISREYRNYDEEIEILKSSRDYYENSLVLIKKEHNQREVDYLQRRINEHNRKIKKLQIEKEVLGLAIPYLDSKGIDFDMGASGNSFAFKIARFENKRYIEYYLQSCHEYIDADDELKETCGKLIFDDKGKLLLALDTSDDFYISSQDLDDFEEIEPDKIFISREDAIINLGNKWIPRYAHYKLDGEKYVRKHLFTEKDSIRKNSDRGDYATFRKLKLGNGDLGVCFGRLYSISKGDYLSDLEFDNLFDYSFPNILTPFMGVLLDDAYFGIKRVLEANDLLMGVTTIKLGKEDKINTVVYLDKEGKIASEIFYYPYFFRYDKKVRMKSELLCKSTSNETYYDDMNKVEEDTKKYIKDSIDSELAKEERERKLNELECERILHIMTTLHLSKDSIDSEVKKLIIKPKKDGEQKEDAK